VILNNVAVNNCHCIQDKLPLKGISSGPHDLSKFWEITDNILETVQDRDIVAMED